MTNTCYIGGNSNVCKISRLWGVIIIYPLVFNQSLPNLVINFTNLEAIFLAECTG